MLRCIHVAICRGPQRYLAASGCLHIAVLRVTPIYSFYTGQGKSCTRTNTYHSLALFDLIFFSSYVAAIVAEYLIKINQKFGASDCLKSILLLITAPCRLNHALLMLRLHLARIPCLIQNVSLDTKKT